MKIDSDVLPLPNEPYRGILPFRLLDWRIFLERDVEAERLGNLVSMYSGVLLYGQSGAGKSSLVNAGLIPHALRQGRAPERIRVFPERGRELLVERIQLQEREENEVGSKNKLPRYLRSRFTSSDDDERIALSCEKFLETLRMSSKPDAELGVPLLIFDQFEELVTLFEENPKDAGRFRDAREARLAIDRMLCELLLNDPLPFKIVFAFRDDYLARLSPLFSRIPNLMDQGVRLASLPVELLKQIVRGPFVRSEDGERGLPGHFADELSEELADKIAAGIAERRPCGILNLSEVQTLCLALWRQPKRREELLGANNPAAVLQEIIESTAVDTLRKLLPWDRVRALALLANLVTQEGTRDVVSEENLISETRRNPLMRLFPKNWRKLLNELPEKTGLLRRSFSSGTTYYELASEFLISWIQKRQRAFRRFALIVSGSISVGLFAILVVLAVLYFQLESQKRIAQKERDNATAQTKIAQQERKSAIAQKKAALANEAAAKKSAGIATALKISWRGSNQAQTKLDLALLLSNQAVLKSEKTFEARNALLTCLLSSPQLSTFLRGHKDTVRCLAFSPDGTTLASADAKGNIIFWDPYTGYMTKAPYKAHEGYIYSIAFSPNGKSLASASTDHTVKIWDAKTSGEIASLRHPDSVYAVAFTPDGTRLASAGADKTVRIWDVQTRKEFKQLTDHKEAVYTVAFSADNKWLASAGSEHKIILWDAKTLKTKGVIEVEKNDAPIFKILFSRDSKSVLVSSATGVITKWDIASPKKASKRFEDHTRAVYGMDLSETKLASASADRTVKLRDPEGGKVKSLTGYGEAAYSVAFGLEGNMLAAGFADGVIAVWDFTKIAQLAKPVDDVAGSVHDIALGPGGRILAVAQGKSIVLWDVLRGEWMTPALSRHTGEVRCVAISPNGKIAASGGDDMMVRLWNVATGEQIGPALSGHTDLVWSIAFSHDGKILASGSFDNTVRLWDVHSRKSKILEGRAGVGVSVSFSPDDKQLASGSSDGTIRRWNVETGHEIDPRLTNPDGKVYRVALGTQAVACANFTRGITLWDFSAGEPRPRRRRLAAATAFSSIAFDQDGRTLLSISAADDSVTRWDASSGNPLPKPPKGGSSDDKAVFSELATNAAVVSHGRITVSASPSGTRFGQIIDTGPGEVVRIESTYGGDTIVARASGRVILLDGKTLQPKGKPLQLPAGLADVASSPIADVLACASGKQVTLWDIKTKQQLGRVDLESSATRVVYSPDGKTFATGDEEGNVRLWVWDADTKSLKRSDLDFEGHKGPVIDLAFHPQKNVLLSTGKDKELIRQPLNQAQVPVLVGELDVSRLAVSPDGALIACGTNDGHVVLVDASSEKEIKTLAAEQPGTEFDASKREMPINELVFTRDGKLLASSVGNQAVQLWDVEGQQQFGPPLSGFSSEIRALKFTADGKCLLTADDQGTLLRWDMNTEEWEKVASTLAGRKLEKKEWEEYMGKEPYEPFPDAWLALKEAINAFVANESREKVALAFREAVEAAARSNDPVVNNSVCWQGSVRGFAPIVLPAGQRSFELATKSDERNVGYYQDTLALALALTHNTPVAIKNFKAFVQWAKDHGAYSDNVAKREEWIRKLENGNDPFTPETLRDLLNEVTSLN
jgi:WD40 repeat protein